MIFFSISNILHSGVPSSSNLRTSSTMQFFSQKSWALKRLEGYRPVQIPSEERPSESKEMISSDIALLEKDVQDLIQEDSCYSHYSRVIQFNCLVFLFYIATILLIVTKYRTQASKGPNVVQCKRMFSFDLSEKSSCPLIVI